MLFNLNFSSTKILKNNKYTRYLLYHKEVTMKKLIENLDITGGILLILCSIATIGWVNVSPEAYQSFNNYIIIAGLDVKHFVNDVLMTLFFFMIGLEVVREVKEGALSSKDKILLPLITAISGFVVPAVIFVGVIGVNKPETSGWAIPTATDIAFALGILALLGSRVPVNLKILLMAIAVIDDLLAIATIAIFYTSELKIHWLLMAIVATLSLSMMSKKKVGTIAPYIFVGIILWLSMYLAGVHATLAGVITAIFMPRDENGFSHKKEHHLHMLVTLLIVPILHL